MDISVTPIARSGRRTAGVGQDSTTICVQGLGFVGIAMATAAAEAVGPDGRPLYRVVGVEKQGPRGERIAGDIRAGILPIATTDARLHQAFHEAVARGNLTATTNPAVYAEADVVIVDINLDVQLEANPPTANLSWIRDAARTIGRHIRPGALVLVETTVPPGTCEQVIRPALAESLTERGLDPGTVHIAHSYERVMPGPHYLDSIANYWRVYAGLTPEAADKCETFLKSIINTCDYPLTRLASTTASEMGKILENTYRATTIALMDEWGRFAEAAGVDLFEVIDAIRMRPTHANMRQPGLGVGGYCLTKDPMMAGIAARQILDLPDARFPLSEMAVRTNQRMPEAAIDRARTLLGGFAGKRVLLCGASYRSDVADTRYSPSETFYRGAMAEGAAVTVQDPLVTHWDELGLAPTAEIPEWHRFDAVIFAVAHAEYGEINFSHLPENGSTVFLDANRVLSPAQVSHIRSAGYELAFIGRGT
ncbi:MAG: nucleotide sugar dehydrogenase [Rhodothermales bacterium]|nr:nucleotide sugar dehydrogenase [Rhodothermales bacterium]MBO6781065.1 nucleotide sugar dehydrogenase [Rhodothermales bacterium]